MLILPHSCFIHVPKTGGSWVKQAVAAAGIPFEELSEGGTTHLGLRDCPRPDLFKFGFVRHPLSLYRSYWQYKMTVGWDRHNELDMRCQSLDFNDFVSRVLQHYPGIYSRSLEEFLGPEDGQVEFVGRLENLVEDLVSALTQAGESFDAELVRGLPPVNVSDKGKAVAEFTPAMEAAVREAEAEAFRRFGYS